MSTRSAPIPAPIPRYTDAGLKGGDTTGKPNSIRRCRNRSGTVTGVRTGINRTPPASRTMPTTQGVLMGRHLNPQSRVAGSIPKADSRASPVGQRQLTTWRSVYKTLQSTAATPEEQNYSSASARQKHCVESPRSKYPALFLSLQEFDPPQGHRHASRLTATTPLAKGVATM